LFASAIAAIESGHIEDARVVVQHLECRPDTLAADWRRLGCLFFEAGDIEMAMGALHRATRREPRDAGIRFELARVLRAAGQNEQAVEELEAACRLDPSDPRGPHLMGVMHLEQGLIDGAIAWLAKAASAGGDSPDLFADRGLAFQAQGDMDAAEAAYRAALQRDPEHIGALRGLARLARRRTPREEAVETLISSIVRTDNGGLLAEAAGLLAAAGRREEALALLESRLAGIADREGRMEMHFRLGELFDIAGDSDAAMEHFLTANRLKDARFDPLHYQGLVDRLLASFDAESIQGLPRASHGDRRPVFIVGMPRSGTSLVEQVIASHSQAFGAGELSDMGLLALSAGGGGVEYPESVRGLSATEVTAMATAYQRRLDALAPGALRVTDKMWQNFEFLGFIELLFPESRVIHCVRDPMDTGLSCFFQHFFGSGVSFSYDLENIGAYYRQYRRIMEHWKAVLQIPILDVSYEALVEAPEAGMRRLLEFVGLDWQPACLRFFETERVVRTASFEQVRKPIYHTSVGKHRRYRHWLGPLEQALRDPS
jgi:tetratricopeptide (TPR) repeat protein